MSLLNAREDGNALNQTSPLSHANFIRLSSPGTTRDCELRTETTLFFDGTSIQYSGHYRRDNFQVVRKFTSRWKCTADNGDSSG